MTAGLLAERPGACPRCGASLRFEDDDGVRECVCGWSERSEAAALDPPSDFGDGDDEDAGADGIPWALR